MSENKKPSLGKNFLMNSILTMSSFIFPLITFPYVSRILLAEGNGKLQFAASIVSYFIMISQLGIPTYGIRACAIVRDNRRALSKTTHELLFISIGMSALAYAVFFLLLAHVPRMAQEKTLFLITSANILLTTISVEWLFKAMEQYTYITVRSLVFKVISVVAMFLLVQQKEDYEIYAAISVFASSGSGIMNLTRLPKMIDCKYLGSYDIKKHMKPVFVFFAMTCAATVYTNLDSVMLGFMATDADVGYYAAAVKIKNILVSVVTALSTVLLPRVSYYYEQKQLSEFWQVVSKAVRVVLLMAVPLCVYFMLFARNGILFLSGPDYENAVAPMVAIMPTLICIGLTSVLGIQVLVPMGKEKAVLYSYILGAVVDCVANAVLIPHFQALGAAIGTLIAEAAVFAYQYVVLRKQVSGYLKEARIPLLFLVSAVCAIMTGWMSKLPMGDFFILLISAVCFFSIYLGLLHLGKESCLLELETIVLQKIKKNKQK